MTKTGIKMENEKKLNPGLTSGDPASDPTTVDINAGDMPQEGKSGKKKAFGIAAGVLAFVAVLLAVLFVLQQLLVPKYMYFNYEDAKAAGAEYGGGMISEYYRAKTQHDVIFLGDCEFFETVDPVTLWEQYGISSYVRGSPQQLIWHSYYILLDTLKTEKPAAVVFNAMEMKIGEVQSEANTRLTLDGMRFSKYKMEAAKLSISEEGESLLSYAFPIMRYHSRWQSLTYMDFEYLLCRDPVTFNGYLMMTAEGGAVLPVIRPSSEKLEYDTSDFPKICWEYLDKLRILCEEEGIELILFKAPTQSTKYYWFEGWEQKLDEYAEEYGLRYINGIELQSEMGLDMKTDSYDGGIHLNVNGAEKCSSYLGAILHNEVKIPDRRSEEKLSEAWNDICERYYDAKKAQTDAADGNA